MSIEDVIREEARLIILRELYTQPNRSATSTSICNLLARQFMIVKPREWVEQEFAWMAQMGAVKVTPAASIQIATLTPHGIQHLKHQAFIPGILSPSEPL